MVTLQTGTMMLVIIVIVIIAVVLALLYRLGYFGGRRGKKGGQGEIEQAFPQYKPEQKSQQRQRPSPLQPSQEVPAGQGGRALLIESKPVDVKPLQSPEKPIDIDRIEKLIRGIENELVQILRQTSADTTDLLLSRINELKSYIGQLERQCLMQSPPFVQMGYIPSSLLEFKELFRASFVGLMKGKSIIEHVGEYNIDERLISSVVNYNMDLMVVYSGNRYVYLVKYGDYSLILSTDEYLDSVSSGLVRLLFKRFIDEVFKP